MKILYIYKSLALLAGTERVLVDKMNYLASQGHQVCIVTYEQGNHSLAFDMHPSVKHVDLNTRFFTLSRYNIFYRFVKVYQMKAFFQRNLRKVIEDFNPDIISCTTYSLKIAGNILKVKNGAKVILESHVTMDSLFKAFDYKMWIMRKVAYLLIDKRYLATVKRFDAFVVLTKNDAAKWRQFVSPVVIPNPVIIDEKWNCDGNVYKRILSAGRLTYQKGYDLLINAYKIVVDTFPEWHLDIYGTGELKEQLSLQINQLGLTENITIEEPVKDIKAQYVKSDFYVMSSRFEGFGMVLVEAMSCGLPCVSFDCPDGPSEVISDGKDGLLASNGDVDDLAAKMIWMISHKTERRKMGINAAQSAKKYDINSVMLMWINLFDEILS